MKRLTPLLALPVCRLAGTQCAAQALHTPDSCRAQALCSNTPLRATRLKPAFAHSQQRVART